jgi:opacity protein-like surface antigen
MRAVKWIVVLALVLAAVPAWAQVDEKKINVNFGGGYTFALSEVRNHLGDGYNFDLGLTVNFTPKVGLQVEYGFNGLGKKTVMKDVASTPGGSTTPQQFSADMNMQYLDFNVVLRPKPEGKASPYIVAGVGYYYRPVKVTTPGVGYVPGYCDPWWGFCYPGGWVPVDKILGSRSSNDIGMDVGGGVSVKLGDSASLYIEARYHYIWGPSYSVTDPTTNKTVSGTATGQFLPITVGIRF